MSDKKNKSNQAKTQNNADIHSFIRWIRNNIYLEDGKYQVKDKAKDQISETRNEKITNPLVMLYELVQHIDYLNSEIARYKKEIENSSSWWEKNFGTKDKELNQLKYKQQELKSRIESLSKELKKLTIERDDYKSGCDDYDKKFQKLLGEKSNERLDKNKHYKMTDSRPLSFQIREHFEKLGKSLYRRSNEIIAHVKSKEIISNERHQTIANISVIFSERILLEYWELLKSSQNFQEEDTSEIITNITNFIFSDLGIDKDYPDINQIRQKVDNLVRKGRLLLRDICQTDPPGEIFEIEIEEENIKFNSDEHQAMTSCKSEGKVQFTVFPGYRVNDVIHKVPIVFTVEDEDNKKG